MNRIVLRVHDKMLTITLIARKHTYTTVCEQHIVHKSLVSAVAAKSIARYAIHNGATWRLIIEDSGYYIGSDNATITYYSNDKIDYPIHTYPICTDKDCQSIEVELLHTEHDKSRNA